ncbi:FlgB family protein [Tabrizicola oligotrophica]|uniref:FlgB family protein n=1 Tax=Tabrizicola oligotrophica TaxID=2710650 RepID=A0A6M0QUG8_9RHOB|nr:FlgB family protein [Tabrizicola oligotrophica]NEY91136.1 FlgB family protein [Tabrizicola oligotrophica]
MFEKLQITAMAQSMASHAGARMGLIAQNVANADTPGFKAMDLPSFAEAYRAAEPGALRQTRVGHLGGLEAETLTTPRQTSGAEAPNGNSVSLEEEMVKAASARQDHEMALAIYRNTSDIIRASLGRK